ncbi:MAG TPA: iron uptake transporter permease EfeU [Actinomycetota bacterium]|nr:iron uptake transporter permease EfeU [Actinomycetota bacterium]
MIPTFVIGLREGIEASLIVGIVAAFLARADRRDALRWMWLGVAAAIVICLGVGIALDAISSSLPQKQQEGFETIIALVAVGTVTAMIVWMKRHSRGIKSDLETHAADALANGTGIALVGMAFLAVLREGFETAVFLLAAFQASETPLASGIGVILGISTAVVLGFLIYRGAVRINLQRFFLVTGMALVLVAAGLVASAIHSAFEAGWLTLGQQQALDLRWLVAPGTVRASLLTGMLGLQPEPTRAEVIGWLLYAVPMSLYLLIPAFRGRQPEPAGAVLENAA